MERYFKRVAAQPKNSPVKQESPLHGTQHRDSKGPLNHSSSSAKRSRIDVSTLPLNSAESVASVVLNNAPLDNCITSPMIQKDIASCCEEPIDTIVEEIGDDCFGILVDVWRDDSYKQQMALYLRYVDKRGFLMEKLVGLTDVTDSSAESLREMIYSRLEELSLRPTRIGGQGHNGISNMRDHIHELSCLIMDDCPSAYYMHFFDHQIQSILVKVAQKHFDVERFIDLVNRTLNTIGTSYRRRDAYGQKQAEMVEEALLEGELPRGNGLNQEVSIQSNGDAIWDSHFKTFCNFIHMFSLIINLLDALVLAGDHNIAKTQAILDGIQTFDFAFMVHLMKLVTGRVYPLSHCLQRREEDIVNAIPLIRTSNILFQKTKVEGWDSLLNDVKSFCIKHEIDIPGVDELAPIRIRGKSKNRVSDVTVETYYRINVFNTILDMETQELNSLFTETSTQLLIGVASLNPANSFSNYHKEKILKMAQLYPDEFDELAIDCLEGELDTCVGEFSCDQRFSNLSTIGELSRTLVQTDLHRWYPMLYKLLKLALILPIYTASVESGFSTTKVMSPTCEIRYPLSF